VFIVHAKQGAVIMKNTVCSYIINAFNKMSMQKRKKLKLQL